MKREMCTRHPNFPVKGVFIPYCEACHAEECERMTAALIRAFNRAFPQFGGED